jgi:adenylosuccinate lyase
MAEKDCGLPITDGQINEMADHIGDIPYDTIAAIEDKTRHDVVAHLKAFAEQCPTAAPIIHLGATSCYITDNADVAIMKIAMEVIENCLIRVVDKMSEMAWVYDNYTMVGRTHFQPAQPVTLGKRFAMWAQDFKIDLKNLQYQMDQLRPLGCRGATGTADSFLQLFDGDVGKVMLLEKLIIDKMGFSNAFPVSGQTYTRKQDYYVLQVLSGIAQSASKFATDIRLLAGLGEVSESFGESQVGSSAMPYKKNPITCEKICGLSRYVIVDVQNAAITASSQWLERTLDDSSNRRVVIPEMFIAIECILNTCMQVLDGFNVHDDIVDSHIEEHRDNIMMEGVLVESVKRGGNRQQLHEKLREYAMSKEGVLAVKIAEDPDFHLTLDEVQAIRSRVSIGMAPEQVAMCAEKFEL